MDPGDVVADRFEIEEIAGAGGMGTVYRARDRASGGLVALKILGSTEPEHIERFTREAEVLAELRHPNIVKYVAHGVAEQRDAYLAMEWLVGETLAARLSRQGLTLVESLELGRRIAEGLSALHRRGVVHRDLKPGNLFLVGGAVDEVRLLDFGIARRRSDTARELTATGATLGTPGYMAPEQARGERDLDARADVFALGCVLFRCLTGRVAFPGDDTLAVLFKVVFQEAPRASEVNEAIPPAVDALITRMLARAPGDRPADAIAVAHEIAALGDLPAGQAPGEAIPSRQALTTIERRVVCLVLLRPPRAGGSDEATHTLESLAERDAALRAEVERHQGALDVLADGSLIVALSGVGTATDQAAKAARCALAIRPIFAGASLALVAGRSVVSVKGERTRRSDASKNPMGRLIARGVALLDEVRSGVSIRIDPITAGLLDPRFEVLGDGSGLELSRELATYEGARTLLGRPSPCVGRDRELGLLTSLWDECRSEPVARVMLVTAPAGVGKSRLLQEVVRRVRAGDDEPLVLEGRGDPLSVGSPLGVLASALRRSLGLFDGEPPAVARAKIAGRVGRNVPAVRAPRVAEFLAELLGARAPGTESPELLGARQDAMLMGDQMRRAWEELLGAECGAQPVLLVLEDMQWGDLASVKFVDAALRSLADKALFVLAVGRPEVRERFPGLWGERELQEIRLGPLTKKSAERLVRHALPHLPDATVGAVADRAAGNAFYLEELIRAVSRGDETLPETVLAMVEARLARLDPELRRALRAASVFGGVFWEDGVAELLGEGERDRRAEVAARLDALVDAELVARRPTSKFTGREELAFRQGLVREAAYAALTDGDRLLGHRLAGAWLESAGEPDALVLAGHFESGGDPLRAVAFYRDAAQQALAGNDFEAAIARAERGVHCGATGDVLGYLRLVQAEAHRWRGEIAVVADRASEAMRCLPPGSPAWCAAASESAIAAGKRGDGARVREVADDLVAHARNAEPTGPLAIAMARSAAQLSYVGQHARAREILDRLGAVSTPHDDLCMARIHQARSLEALFGGDPAGYKAHTQAAAEHFERTGDLRGACLQRANLGDACMEVGAYAESVVTLTHALAGAERLGIKNAAAFARHNLGLALARVGRLEEARKVAEEGLLAILDQRDPRLEAVARAHLATIHALAGDLGAAHAEASRAVDRSTESRNTRPLALATLATVLLAEGRGAEALAATREASALLESLGGVEDGEVLVRLAHAEALAATGDGAAALVAIRSARDRLLARAGKIRDGALRASFLGAVPENARTLSLAEELGA